MPTISLYFVRHGQRIDQVDASWVDTSPFPQDPPLTDLGKQQARLTGKMIKNLTHENLSLSCSLDEAATIMSKDKDLQHCTLQRITPPVTPDFGRCHLQSHQNKLDAVVSPNKRLHHFAIVTSPFLRCSQTAIEIAIGMKMATADSETTATTGPQQVPPIMIDTAEICDEKWLSLEYVSEPVSDSIIVQRMQDFAKARRNHEKYYSIDWKYIAKDRQLPTWPETREDMQARQERALDHILEVYTRVVAKDKDRDLSIVFVTHASPVNGKGFFTY
ncbi:hypothetical protein BGZ65_005417 [Modicella reniformis]|uniref:Uncharacterized protein n=1 Tax=Modicella reniformis TaxID=1440133 RepID=A0A9P6IK78_9FUNG|nr:hypothetical protein BGZ65_005417 [Modicella reniformis]